MVEKRGLDIIGQDPKLNVALQVYLKSLEKFIATSLYLNINPEFIFGIVQINNKTNKRNRWMKQTWMRSQKVCDIYSLFYMYTQSCQVICPWKYNGSCSCVRFYRC